MVRAILAGTKSQTRRIVKGQRAVSSQLTEFGPHTLNDGAVFAAGATLLQCPYGAPGDRLWVRETHCPRYFDDGKPGYRADWSSAAADLCPEPKWKPSIFMRRHDSRITLEVTGVRVERLRAITEEDAVAEGVDLESAGANYRLANGQVVARSLYSDLWDSINAKRGSWKDNPWVFVIEFRRIES